MPINDDKLERCHNGWLLRGDGNTWEIVKVGNKEVTLRRQGEGSKTIKKPREMIQAWLDTRLVNLFPMDEGISKFGDWLKERRERRLKT